MFSDILLVADGGIGQGESIYTMEISKGYGFIPLF